MPDALVEYLVAVDALKTAVTLLRLAWEATPDAQRANVATPEQVLAEAATTPAVPG